MLADGFQFCDSGCECSQCLIAILYIRELLFELFLLDKEGFAYENLTAEEHADLCRQYGIKGAPTLVLTDGVHFEKYYGVAEIKKYLQSAGTEQVG